MTDGDVQGPEQQEMAGHLEGVRTARKFLEDEENIEALLLSVQYEEGHREGVTTQSVTATSEQLFDMLADHVVFLADKHDSHPAGVLDHLIKVVQEREDTPATGEPVTDGGTDASEVQQGEQIPTLDDVLDMELAPDGERRYLVLYDEDYDDLLIDAGDSVALLVDNNQALEVLRLASEIVAELAPEHAPDEEPIDAMVEALQEVQTDGE